MGDLEHLLIVAGNSDEENPYRKGSSVQTYLLGYEFPSTLMLLTKSKVYFVVSSTKGASHLLPSALSHKTPELTFLLPRKAKLLTPILTAPASAGDDKVEVEILTRTKDDAENKKLFGKILEVIGSGNKVGTLPKDKMVGKFVTEWTSYVAESGIDVKEIDAGPGVSALLAVKDEEELVRAYLLREDNWRLTPYLPQRNESHAAKMTNQLMSHFSDVMSSDIDEGKKVTHEQLGERIEQRLEDAKFWRKLELGDGFETGFGDWCYSPIIQSGGSYDLKSSAQTDDRRLTAGVILCSLGIRYKSYCSNVGRTFMVDPDAAQEKNYLFLVDLQKFVLGQLIDGAICKEVFGKVVERIEAERPDLSPYFVKTVGFGMGLEFRDAAYTLGPKCGRTIKANMIFSLTLGFNNIPTGKGDAVYALSLIDTVKVTKNGGTVLSEGMKSKDSVMFFMEEAEKKPSKSAKSKDAGGKPPPRKAAPTAVVKSTLRSENREIDADALNRRKQHQKELATRRHENGLERFSEDGVGGKGNREKQWRRFESYVRHDQLPESVSQQKIMVDARKNTVLLPINGFAVPFHIQTLKSVIKQEEGDFTVLRFMFTTPGAITGKKEDTPFEDPSATFIRGLTYRSTDSFRFAEIHKEINDLKKAATKRDNERKELADVVEQDRLVETKGKRPIKLTDVQVRPSFDGKRQSGDVEIHSNGIRYQSSLKSDQKIGTDILFSNMKHLLFQPCDQELIAVLHVHLKHPIVIGKKKAKDIQFFREASDASFDETGNKKRRKNYHDEDELQSEQEERKRRADLNKYFKAFADKIAEASNGRIEVDIPFRELGFQGVPFRSNVLLQPTTDTLVFLTEPPFLVLTLAEIEIAHLERVQYGLKNFDMVFVFQDFTRTPVHINTIPMAQLDNVKEWLDSVDIPFSEGPVNLNWSAIIGTIKEDPLDFFKEGGWGFLQEQDADEGSGDSSEEGSSFNASSDGGSSDEGSDFDDGSESGSDFGDEEEDSEDDWDAQEKKLEKRGGSDDEAGSDDSGSRKKSSKKSGGGAVSSKSSKKR
ncbi:FACT complex subunit SPT16, partial [Phenoliferia sp. Uapishka_3]